MDSPALTYATKQPIAKINKQRPAVRTCATKPARRRR